MNVQPTKSFVFRYSEADLALWSRVLAYILSSDAAAGAFEERERRVLAVYHRELSRTLETAHDDDGLTPAGETPARADAGQPQRPVCQVHQQPMWRQRGKHGWFWSCHQRNDDGSYCTYRPARAAAAVTQALDTPAEPA